MCGACERRGGRALSQRGDLPVGICHPRREFAAWRAVRVGRAIPQSLDRTPPTHHLEVEGDRHPEHDDAHQHQERRHVHQVLHDDVDQRPRVVEAAHEVQHVGHGHHRRPARERPGQPLVERQLVQHPRRRHQGAGRHAQAAPDVHAPLQDGRPRLEHEVDAEQRRRRQAQGRRRRGGLLPVLLPRHVDAEGHEHRQAAHEPPEPGHEEPAHPPAVPQVVDGDPEEVRLEDARVLVLGLRRAVTGGVIDDRREAALPTSGAKAVQDGAWASQHIYGK